MTIFVIISVFLLIASIALALTSLYFKNHHYNNQQEKQKYQKNFKILISVSVILLILSIVVYKLFGNKVNKLQLAKEILSEQDSNVLDTKCVKLFSTDAGLKKQYLDFRGSGDLSYETANLCRKYAQTIAGVKV